MTSRRARQARILRLLARGPVPSHEALRQLLAGEGIEATQATLSRDLREIGAVKGGTGYTLASALVGDHAHVGQNGVLSGHGGAGLHGGLHGGSHLGAGTIAGGRMSPEAALAAVGRSAAMRTFVVSVERGGSIVVLRTGPGHASLVAAEIDRDPLAGVLGTVAGDDTIFVACRGEAAARRVHVEFAQSAGVMATTKTAAARGGR